MNLLAIETATESCSVALLCGEAMLMRSEIAPRRHAELILPMIASLLEEAGLARGSIDAIAVGRGPGAFTGVRLGISIAQGLALGLDIPVVPVSSLAALAMQAPDDGAAILAAIDARMGEVYVGCFRRKGPLVESLSVEAVGLADKITLPQYPQWNVIGTGWGTYHAALQARLSVVPQWAESACYPQADAIARLALPALRAGHAVAPELALPVYLRDKVALTLAEQGKVGAAH
jgi:tRNA threonylcarbamoyladenosine biosynthesis protein TsaB